MGKTQGFALKALDSDRFKACANRLLHAGAASAGAAGSE